MNSEYFSSSLTVSKLVGLHSSSKCPWGVCIFRRWLRGLANIQVRSSRSEGPQIEEIALFVQKGPSINARTIGEVPYFPRRLNLVQTHFLTQVNLGT